MKPPSLWLRPYREEDAACMVGWIGDERTLRKWSADRYDHYPLCEEDIRARYREDDPERLFPMMACDESGVVGHFILRYKDEEKTWVRIGFVILDPAKRGKGCGKAMIQAAVRYAQTVLGARRITLGVFENNPSAYWCYRSVGFSEQGDPTSYTFQGEVWNCIEMEWKP